MLQEQRLSRREFVSDAFSKILAAGLAAGASIPFSWAQADIPGGDDAYSILGALRVKCTTPQKRRKKPIGKQSTWDTYARNVFSVRLSDLPLEKLARERIELPSDMEQSFEEELQDGMGNGSPKLEEMIFSRAHELGYTDGMIKDFSPREAIHAAMKIVTETYTHHRVDTDPEFIKKYGQALPLERYFSMGLGDCDVYTDTLKQVFLAFKKRNDRLGNVYILGSIFGGFLEIPHAWNTALVIGKEKIHVSHIDTNRRDRFGENKEDDPNRLYPADHPFFLGNFYMKLDLELSYGLLKRAFLENKVRSERDRILVEMAGIASAVSDWEKMDWVLEKSSQEGILTFRPSILLLALYLADETKQEDRGRDLKNTYIRESPHYRD
ncbi:hypothetical protein HYV84_08345 [Candidatus Woesearchaeota archaeon]|nr:hypothetical protein [Candidatus Woesearchaeota archaeon]